MKVVHCKKEKYDVYIGRPSIFGNPFGMKKESDRTEVIEQFRNYLIAKCAVNQPFREAVLDLRGKTLACWCAPKPCHGDVIIEWLDRHDG